MHHEYNIYYNNVYSFRRALSSECVLPRAWNGATSPGSVTAERWEASRASPDSMDFWSRRRTRSTRRALLPPCNFTVERERGYYDALQRADVVTSLRRKDRASLFLSFVFDTRNGDQGCVNFDDVAAAVAVAVVAPVRHYRWFKDGLNAPAFKGTNAFAPRISYSAMKLLSLS